MTLREKAQSVIARDFAILVTICATWGVDVLTAPHAGLGDLAEPDNLRRLLVLVLGFVILYAQRVRTTGEWVPPLDAAPEPPPTP